MKCIFGALMFKRGASSSFERNQRGNIYTKKTLALIQCGLKTKQLERPWRALVARSSSARSEQPKKTPREKTERNVVKLTPGAKATRNCTPVNFLAMRPTTHHTHHVDTKATREKNIPDAFSSGVSYQPPPHSPRWRMGPRSRPRPRPAIKNTGRRCSHSVTVPHPALELATKARSEENGCLA